jgi:drug/metabolite transporter (DMT)-like permease
MTACKEAGLADPSAQFYMFFYYLGPAALVFTLIQDHRKQQQDGGDDQTSTLPSRRAVLKACGIAVFDIISQALNYTGAGMAGATIFAVIYSSVTIWTALWSRLILKRSLSWTQWLAVCIVFGGLAITALESADMGPNVKRGAILVGFGSAMHGASYVLSEAIMSLGPDRLTVRQNAAIQSVLAAFLLGIWQLVYTLPRWDIVIGDPVREAGTTLTVAVIIMASFALANLIHSLSFYHTLRHYPGGSTSAGVMKGLQAVLVFGATHVLFCGRTGGEEMCFSIPKLVSLVTVVGGVAVFGLATEKLEEKQGYARISSSVVHRTEEDTTNHSHDGGRSSLSIV